MPPYTLRTDLFEGPLDLLLALIEKRKLLINDIALAEVADDYIKYLEGHREFPVAETAQFVLVGSALLLIKSRSLLPQIDLTSEEEQSVEDLEARLRLLERYQSLGKGLAARFGETPLYRGQRSVIREPVFSPDNSMTLDVLQGAAHAVLAHLPRSVPKLVEATVRKVVSLEEVMERLTERINANVRVSFRDFAAHQGDRLTLIVSFLAMLELVRQGVVRVEQEAYTDDITIHADTVGVPRYG